MESSSEQALIIGVNVFILIIALTCAIMLMTTVLNMSNAANTVIKTTTGSTLMTLYGGTNDRVYTGEQVLAVVEEYFSPTTNMEEKYVLMIDGNPVAGKANVRTVTLTKSMLDSMYRLKYVGKEDGTEKYIYNFEKIQGEVASEG